MAYTPPDGDAIEFDFTEVYTAPDGDDVLFDFAPLISIPHMTVTTFLSLDSVSVGLPIQPITATTAMELSDVAVGIFPQLGPMVSSSSLGMEAIRVGILISPMPATTGLELSGVILVTLVPISPMFSTVSLELDNINVFSTVNSALLYFLTITGEADSLPDIELPMSSFQSRRRSGEQTSLTAVIPTVDFAQEISDRSNGTMRIDQGYKKGGVIVQRETIIETDISRADLYEGGNSQSQILTGYSTTTYTPKTVELSTPVVRSVIDGSVRYRVAEPYIFLNPGDTVIIGNDNFICDIMSYAISVDSQTVEIGEE